MNHSNIILTVASFIIAAIFFSGVFLNLEIKKSRNEIVKITKEIEDLRLDIERKQIEIATLTSPLNVIKYIEKNDLKPVKLKNIEKVIIKKDN
jgi:cell division protein FtsL